MNSQSSAKSSPHDIPGLDGLRAFSVIAVVLSHAMTWRFIQPVGGLWRLEPGSLGVSIFFVISGYLITTLLLREHRKKGHIDVTAFWLRRAFRILPAMMIYIIVMVALTIAGLAKIPVMAIVSGITFTQDIFSFVHWLMTHLWSLAVEQQFYLVYPLLLVYLLGESRKHLKLIVAGAVLGIPLLVRIGDALGYLPVSNHSFQGRMDMLALGCITAIFQMREAMSSKTKLSGVALKVSAVLMIISICLPEGLTRYGLFDTLMGCATALVIFKATHEPKHWLAQVLSLSLLEYIGKISYSVYLWQQAWFYGENTLSITIWHALGGTLICSLLSYYFVELPGINMRTFLVEKWHRHIH